jgi:hypothetical protein
MMHCSRILRDRRDFVLLASESLDVEANPRSLQVYQRWFDMMMLVRGSSPHAS